MFKTIEESAKALQLECERKPFIGTAATRKYNAFAAPIPDTEEFLIVFETEIFTLANLLAKTICSCLPNYNDNDRGVSFSFELSMIKSHIEQNTSLQEKFSDLVYSAIFLREPNRTKHYYISGSLIKLQYTLVQSIELFIVGHEYAHITCGHLRKAKLRLSKERESFQKVSPDWEMEFEADKVGLQLLLKSVEKTGLLPFCLLGPELFFTFIELAERGNNLLKTGVDIRSEGSDTHPPTSDRRERIDSLLKSYLHPEVLESYEVLRTFIMDIIECHWRIFKRNQAPDKK